MNNLNKFIKESLPSANLPLNESNSGAYTMYFKNASAYLIFEFELSGQISDGYWENSHPYDHFKWLQYTKSEIDKNKEGYEGRPHIKKYSCAWLRKYVKQAINGNAGDYDWTIRVFNYGKLGSILTDSQAKEAINKYAIRSIAENLPDEEVNNEQLEAIYTKGADYRKKYWEEGGSFYTDELLKKYYSSNYNWKDCEDDIKSAEKSINTMI